ncbi:MAG: aminodeoxychorismate synthase component I [Planctomycetes bacterium]|nr:aminodeoxychorismate synthase component I [Planctomycetota bacterium]
MDLPLVREIAPAPPAWSTFLKLGRWRGLIFFDSALNDPSLGRHSFIAADPFDWIRFAAAPGEDPFGRNPFQAVGDRLRRFRDPAIPDLPPFQGGAAGLFGYGLGRCLERVPETRRGRAGFADLAVGLYDWVVAFDHEESRAWIISHGFPETELSARRRRARARLEEVLEALAAAPPSRQEAALPPEPAGWPPELFPLEPRNGLASNFSRASYLAAVARAIEYIYAGDLFQANLSQQLYFPRKIPPLEFYRRLRERNPAPFAAYFEPLGEPFAIASASPERFLKVSPEGAVETRPIKGTRARGRPAEEDCFARDALRESGKDRSENVMIVDLLRNDLSRACRPGSVQVPHLFQVETYPTVHQLVSVIRGRLEEGRGPLDLLAAAFPGGSVTGAPKIRALEIIAELEPDPRGAYCGSLGYIGFDGAMDTSILIRTATVTRGWLQFPVGGGIVAASSPEEEYEETLIKARGMLLALRDEAV